MLNGWKAYAGAAIAASSAFLGALGMGEYSEMVLAVGTALGIIGIRNRMER